MPEPITLVAVGGGVMGVLGHLARRYFEIAKEVMDVVLGFIALIVFLPALLACAMLIRLASPGPIFFSQIRVGKDGRPFRMYKLRTMYLDAEARCGAVWASRHDPRVVPACRWMRRSHVDELPQLINVIKGDMSLIGPRPERPEILADLERVYPDIRKRLSVRPGITGLAQIRNGYDTTIEGVGRKLHSDLEYIANRGWATEFRILAGTFAKFHDRGAC